MRPKIVIPLLVFMAIALVGVFYLKPPFAPAPPPAPINTEATALEPVVPDSPQVNVPMTSTITPVPVAKIIPPVVAAAPPAASLSPQQRQALIDAETERLQQWSASSDPADLSKILADLASPEKTVRAAAIEAAKQFGGADASAALKTVAAKTMDPKEQIEMQEAADFIALPSLTSTLPTAPQSPEQIQASRQKLADFEAKKQARILKENHIELNNLPAAPSTDVSATPSGN